MQRDSKIERYLLGQMSPEEEAEFEQLFVTDHAMLEQLELSERLLRGMKALEKDNMFSKADLGNETRIWFKKRVPAWSLAASIMVGLLTGYVGFNTDNRVENIGVNVVNVNLASLRGTALSSATVTQNTQQTLLSMYIDREVSKLNYPEFIFELFDESESLMYSSQSLGVNNVDMLYVNLGNKKFKPGEYQFKLIGLDNNERQELMSGYILFE